jgi:hypothetical protein
MLSILTQYKAIKSSLPAIIKASGYRNDYVAKKLGISPQSFAVKKKRNNWNEDEVEKILSIIDNDDTEDYVMLQLMRSMKDEETITLEEFKRQMGWK